MLIIINDTPPLGPPSDPLAIVDPTASARGVVTLYDYLKYVCIYIYIYMLCLWSKAPSLAQAPPAHFVFRICCAVVEL